MMLAVIAESALRSIALGSAAWLGMKLMRLRNPHLQMTIWTVVLVVSTAMPMLTPWMRLTIPADQMPVRLLPIVLADVSLVAPPVLLQAQGFPVAASSADVAAPEQAGVADWRLLATGAYIVVGGVMIVRLLMGLLLMRRVIGAAHPVRDGWAAGADVRVSDVVRVPVTFASTILLPCESVAWSERKLLAVLLHERSHVSQLDFSVLLLAAINRAVFWFNPFAWWLHSRLADLAEIISDDAAIEGLGDPRCYADVLRDVASSHHRLPAGLAMARPSTVGRRIARVLAATTVSPRICRRKRLLITASLVPLAALSAGTIAPSAAPMRLAPLKLATQHGANESVHISPAQLDRYVGQFQVTGASVLTVRRDGARLFAQETGAEPQQLIALSDHEFITERGDAHYAFVTDNDGPATAVAMRDSSFGLRRRARVDAATASEIEANFKRRVVAVPDRFRDQVPTPGSDAALRALIEDLRHDAPVRMSRQLAERVRRQRVPSFSEILGELGAVELVFFRGVGPGGYDIYGVKFANGLAEFRIDLAADGTMEDFNFQPDGDGTQGGIAACAIEPTLKSSSNTAPIRLVLTNRTGADIRLFWIAVDGRRAPHGTLASDYSMYMLTSIGRPLVIADQAGRCLEIILPGLSTRVHVVEQLQSGGSPGSPAVLRTSPMAGSEAALQRYIEGARRGAPDYDRMTREAGAITLEQLQRRQAILAKLGELRAMSFRGVSQAGNDVYMVQFANGAAEWQIGLVDDGRIGTIALGPQY